MNFIETLTWKKIVDLLGDAQETIYLTCPSIDDVLSQPLCEASKKGVKVYICIDNSETVIRNGYGEEKGIDDLLGRSITLKECSGNRISFLIADKNAYLFFPESLNLIEDTKGYNAISIDEVFALRLIERFFPSEDSEQESKFRS